MSSKEKKEKKPKKSKKEDKDPEPAAAVAEEAPAESGGGGGGGDDDDKPQRAKRGTSNVFALFNQSQIQEFKEAFAMMDQDRDGVINESDLAAIHQQIGREPDPKTLREMLGEVPGPLNFTMFLGLFGEKIKGTDPESTLRDAFAMFDETGKGVLPEEYVKDLLSNTGDPFNKEEIKLCWKECPIEGGMLDYIKFAQYIKRGKEDE